MRVAPVEQRRKKYLILSGGWQPIVLLRLACMRLAYMRLAHMRLAHVGRGGETERFPVFPKDPASKTPLPEFSGLRMRDGHMLRISGRVYSLRLSHLRSI